MLIAALLALFSVLPCQAFTFSWADFDWPDTPPQDFGPVTFTNVDNSGVNFTMTVTGDTQYMNGTSPNDLATLTGGYTPAPQNLYMAQVQGSANQASVLFTIAVSGGTLSNIVMNVFDVDYSANNYIDGVMFRVSDGTTWYNPNQPTTNTTYSRRLTNGEVTTYNTWYGRTDFTRNNTVRGIASASDTTAQGNVRWTVPDTTVDDITIMTIEYFNLADAVNGNNLTQQWIGLFHEFDFDAVAIPEPGSMVLLGLGAVGVALLRRRR
ncbi:MAG TPA: PEP-CTERM sorting domain-containing protein [Candidatus Brocadiia bacterium]|nr:PEP-CTERM sorting domain-containing protein [Candidatus Brocadiia bacterium]